MATRAQGTVLKFTPAGGVQATVGKLRSVGRIAPKADAIDVTTLDSAGGYREYIQGFRDAGELALDGFYEKGDAGQAALRAAFDDGRAGAFEAAFPDGTKAAFSAVVTGYSIGAAEVDGAVGFGATLRLTGGVTLSAAS